MTIGDITECHLGVFTAFLMLSTLPLLWVGKRESNYFSLRLPRETTPPNFPQYDFSSGNFPFAWWFFEEFYVYCRRRRRRDAEMTAKKITLNDIRCDYLD